MEGYFSPAHLLSPPTARAAYSDRTCWIMARMSELAYEEFETGAAAKQNLEDKLSTGGFSLVDTFDGETEHADTQAILVRKPDVMAILAFRGTTGEFKDIFTDLNARWHRTNTGSAHKGFVEAYEVIETLVEAAIAKLPPAEPLYVTGHSLGGALASIAAARLDKVHVLAACYTFGSPRVGNPEWVANMKTPVYRVVNAADGVPLVPLSTLATPFLFWLARVGLIGFRHVGDVRYLPSGGGKYKTGAAATVSRAIRIVGSVALLFIKLDFRKAVSIIFDHKIGNYIAKLEDIAVTYNDPKT